MGDMEIERRPHWSDDLINAVIDLQYHCVECMGDDYPDIDPHNHDAVNAAWAYEVIAVVEDWHKAKRDSRDRTHNDDCWRWHQECAEALIEAQQAAIQRVRELCRGARVGLARGCTCYGNECSGICGYGKPLAWDLDPDAVLRALDGGSDDDNQSDFWDGTLLQCGDVLLTTDRPLTAEQATEIRRRWRTGMRSSARGDSIVIAGVPLSVRRVDGTGHVGSHAGMTREGKWVQWA